MPPETRRNLYGRRSGPSRRPARRALFEQRQKSFYLTPDGALPARLDPAALFDGTRERWLEIGFGAGEHLTATALAQPDNGHIGCEHYLAGVVSCMSKLDQAGVTNAKVYRGDARDLMDALPDGSIGRVFLLYPDPWPKTRHHKRRFVNEETVTAFARILKPGAELRVASDIPDYIEWTETHLAGRVEFRPVHRGPEDIAAAWEGWPGTRYEAKALREGRVPGYLRYERIANVPA